MGQELAPYDAAVKGDFYQANEEWHPSIARLSPDTTDLLLVELGTTLRCMPSVVEVQREELTEADLAELLTWLEQAFGDPIGSWRRDTWMNIGPGPHFMLRNTEGALLAHACIDWVPITIGSVELAAGYLEFVATRADSRRKGLGSLVVKVAQRKIGEGAEIGFLATGQFGLYERTGWVRWTGPTSVRERDGSITRTGEDDDAIMALLLPHTPAWVRTHMPIRRPRRDPEEAW